MSEPLEGLAAEVVQEIDRATRTVLDSVNGQNAVVGLTALHAAAAHLEANLTGYEDTIPGGNERLILACTRMGRKYGAQLPGRATFTRPRPEKEDA